MVRAFAIDTNWPSQDPILRGELDATFCSLRITIDDKVATTFRSPDGKSETQVEAPVYDIAEWVAENWWALLWEPRKTDMEGASEAFAERHAIMSAQRGFPLPNVVFTPAGEVIQVKARARDVQHADVRFTVSAEAFPKRAVVETELRKFVEQTVLRLGDISGTVLQDAWKRVSETDAEAELFCRLMGALGLSPYDSHPKIERALDAASEMLKPEQLLDLCLGSTPDDILRSAYLAGLSAKALEDAPLLDLSALSKIKPPQDYEQAPAFRVGYRSADVLRRHFGIKDVDPSGATKVFRELRLEQAGSLSVGEIAEPSIAGATQKQDWTGRYALTPTPPKSKKFAIGRAAYFLWTGGPDDARMLTNSATRDQQAGRAFAAELLVPQAFIRRSAHQGKLPWQSVHEIANDVGVSPDLVSWQAKNNGLQLVA